MHYILINNIKFQLTSLGLPEMPNFPEDLFRLFKSVDQQKEERLKDR